jgi:hypothetical protein
MVVITWKSWSPKEATPISAFLPMTCHVEVVEPERSYAYFSLSPDDMAKQLSEAGIPCYNLISNPMDFDYYNVKQFPTLLVLDENKNVIGQTSGRGKILAVINRKKLLESS